MKLVFDIKIMDKNRLIFCVYLQRDYDIAAILASTGTTMNMEKTQVMKGHHDKNWMHKIALELGLPLEKGPMKPYEAYSIRRGR